MMLSGKRIILGVTGGIAAYKAAFLLREFQKAGAEVRVVLTHAATRFVGLETFASLSGHEVAVDIFPEDKNSSEWTRHINWGEWADLFVIAPCTANSIAKIAHGISDNMLTSTVLAARCPVLICPTMDGEMYDAPAVVSNLKLLQSNGYHVLEPESGYLASGLEGKGRLPEFDTILTECSDIIGSVKGALTGKKVVITAGATREFIDPVRFISNPSSGKMGFAMAEAARESGADVTVVHGNVSINIPKGMKTIKIESAADMFEEVKHLKNADVIIMAAAVSDFTPVKTFTHKVKKKSGDNTIILTQTEDILAWLGAHKQTHQVLVGFAMETENLEENMKEKLINKKADWIIGNLLGEKEAGFESDNNSVLLMGVNQRQKFIGTKKDISVQIINRIFRTR